MKNNLTTNQNNNSHEVPIHIPVQAEFKNFLNHFWNMVDFPHHHEEQEMKPKIEVSETNDLVKVSAELPGINEKDIDLQISSDGYLTICGEKKHLVQEHSKGNYFSEFSYGTIKRTIPLPWDLNFDKANAEYDNGVLNVSIPKTQSEKAKIKKIDVKKQNKS